MESGQAVLQMSSLSVDMMAKLCKLVHTSEPLIERLYRRVSTGVSFEQAFREMMFSVIENFRCYRIGNDAEYDARLDSDCLRLRDLLNGDVNQVPTEEQITACISIGNQMNHKLRQHNVERAIAAAAEAEYDIENLPSLLDESGHEDSDDEDGETPCQYVRPQQPNVERQDHEEVV